MTKTDILNIIDSIEGNIRQEYKDRHQFNRSFHLKPIDIIRDYIRILRAYRKAIKN